METIRRTRALSLDLWNQVWTQVGDRIATLMETDDWWRANGAYKEMSKVQPKRIQMVPKCTEALWWLVRHWGQAKVLELDLRHLPVGDPYCVYWEDFEVASWEARDVKDQLAGLSGLQALHLQAKRLYNVTTLTQMPLRHLQLELSNSVVIAGLTEVEVMVHLETLMVKCSERPEYFDAYPNGGDVYLEKDLRACTNLHAVAFHIFLPDDLKVPQGCCVNLVGDCLLLTHRISECTSCTCVVNDAEVLSRFLGATFTAMTCLKIDASWEPRGHVADEDGLYPPLDLQVGDNLKHLKSLSLENWSGSRGITLGITGLLQLTSLEVLTEGELNVTMHDVASLATTLQMYHFKSNVHYEDHAQLQTLHNALCCLGKGDQQIYGTGLSFHSAAAEPFFFELYWIENNAPHSIEYVKAQIVACSCNACWECLVKKGTLDLLLV